MLLHISLCDSPDGGEYILPKLNEKYGSDSTGL